MRGGTCLALKELQALSGVMNRKQLLRFAGRLATGRIGVVDQYRILIAQSEVLGAVLVKDNEARNELRGAWSYLVAVQIRYDLQAILIKYKGDYLSSPPIGRETILQSIVFKSNSQPVS